MFAGLSSGDHLRRCSAAVLNLQFGECKGLTQQFGKTKLFLYQHQVSFMLYVSFLSNFEGEDIWGRRWMNRYDIVSV